MGLQKIITQETKQQNNYLESESVLDYDFSITQPELAAVKIYEVRNFKSALRIQKTGVCPDSRDIENKQREFYIVFCNSKQKAVAEVLGWTSTSGPNSKSEERTS